MFILLSKVRVIHYSTTQPPLQGYLFIYFLDAIFWSSPFPWEENALSHSLYLLVLDWRWCARAVRRMEDGKLISGEWASGEPWHPQRLFTLWARPNPSCRKVSSVWGCQPPLTAQIETLLEPLPPPTPPAKQASSLVKQRDMLLKSNCGDIRVAFDQCSTSAVGAQCLCWVLAGVVSAVKPSWQWESKKMKSGHTSS